MKRLSGMFQPGILQKGRLSDSSVLLTEKAGRSHHAGEVSARVMESLFILHGDFFGVVLKMHDLRNIENDVLVDADELRRLQPCFDIA